MSNVTRLRRQPKALPASCRSRSTSEEIPSTPVFDRGRYIGSVTDRQNGFEAGLADGRSLGLFNAFEHACHALIVEATR